MEIREVEAKDLGKIVPLVRGEFAYVLLNEKKMLEKLENEKIFMFKIVEGNEFAGFIELEILEGEVARINGFALEEEFRGKGFGKELLDYAIEFLKEQGIKIVKLLVKRENETAKKIYREAGFGFIGLYPKKLGGYVIEEYELELEREAPKGVS